MRLSANFQLFFELYGMNKTVLHNFKQKSLRRDRKYFSNHLAHFLVLIGTQLVNATRVKAEQLSFLR